MKSQYLATPFFCLEKDPCEMLGFSSPLKVAVQFVRVCRHIVVSFQNLLSVPTGVCVIPKHISFQTLLSFFVPSMSSY